MEKEIIKKYFDVADEKKEGNFQTGNQLERRTHSCSGSSHGPPSSCELSSTGPDGRMTRMTQQLGQIKFREAINYEIKRITDEKGNQRKKSFPKKINSLPIQINLSSLSSFQLVAQPNHSYANCWGREKFSTNFHDNLRCV